MTEAGGEHPFSAWCLPQHIASEMERLERETLRVLTPVNPGIADEIPRRVAVLISEFLLIHPFREGNGRIAQMMGNWLAWQANLPSIAYGIDYSPEKKEAYIVALQKTYDRDYEPLEQFIRAGLDRSLEIVRRRSTGSATPGDNSPE